MRRDSKTEAWEVYRDFYSRTTQALTDEEFEQIWAGLDAYVRAVIRGKVYNCSDFDLDDHLADAQLLLWQRMCQRMLPAHDPAIFIGAVKVTTRRMLIDNYRRDDAERRRRDSYAEGVELVHQPCFATQMWAVEMLKKHRTMIAKMMSKRSRFAEITCVLTRQVVDQFQANAKLDDVMALLKEVAFEDTWFLLEHLQVLYRWCYYDVREQVLEAA